PATGSGVPTSSCKAEVNGSIDAMRIPAIPKIKNVSKQKELKRMLSLNPSTKSIGELKESPATAPKT
ncbi:hypothetical protein U6M95_12565, partial [Cutibacterium acnes]